MKTIPIYIITILLALFGCKKEEYIVPQGDVKYKVNIYNDTHHLLEDMSDISLYLTNEHTNMNSTPDKNGWGFFKKVPFGNYDLTLNKDGYLPYLPYMDLSNLGGKTPLLKEISVYQIPTYSIRIDTLSYDGGASVDIKVTSIGNTRRINRFEGGGFNAHIFFDETPNVSFDNYDYNFFTILHHSSSDTTYGGFIDHWFWVESNPYPQDQVIYARIYAHAPFVDEYPAFNKSPIIREEYLGPPSEVFSFTLADL